MSFSDSNAAGSRRHGVTENSILRMSKDLGIIRSSDQPSQERPDARIDGSIPRKAHDGAPTNRDARIQRRRFEQIRNRVDRQIRSRLAPIATQRVGRPFPDFVVVVAQELHHAVSQIADGCVVKDAEGVPSGAPIGIPERCANDRESRVPLACEFLQLTVRESAARLSRGHGVLRTPCEFR